MPAPYLLPDLIHGKLSAASIEEPVGGKAVAILHVADLAGVREDAQKTPALQIIPYGISINDPYDAGNVVLRESVIVLAVTRFPNQRGGERERQLAGLILRDAALALIGWQPSESYTPLVAETPPLAQHTASFGYYPLIFSSIYQVT